MNGTTLHPSERLLRCAPMPHTSDVGKVFASVASQPSVALQPVRIAGKLLEQGGKKWYIRGLTYGPFQPSTEGGAPFPGLDQIDRDFAAIRRIGANSIRLYHVPSTDLLDIAAAHELRVMVDVPWDKHRCFMEDWTAQKDAIERVRGAAKLVAGHPAVWAVSVGNEIPRDVVRFSGPERVARFIDNLIDAFKQVEPDCLATYTNYPSTEFLSPSKLDFYCANVYLEDHRILGRYLERLHHVAAHLPLVLGELGIDSLRHGEGVQAQVIGRQIETAFRNGLAGTYVFSFTDDWYTGGHAVRDWAFGITDARRREKPAAETLRQAWAQVPRVASDSSLPRVSVVVCSYNGASTLVQCLESLLQLDYPDFEVILVDDGSTDNTREIAERYPQVRSIHQKNLGLSAARNVGALAATGEIVAYTDSDCVVDSHWLLHLVQGMQAQNMDAIGGPNVPPPDDGWMARCVAASPGGPSHVMIDDRAAEHIPGCNMAFRRDQLLALGGFDEQFRAAGDDVDICWRYLDAGLSIGYAASALVWHHRRSRAIDFYRQQRGYGRAEAMLQLKHPARYSALGGLRWEGVIYGVGAVGLPVGEPAVYHGRFGNGPFQIIYRQNAYTNWAYFTLLEWHLVALLLAALGILLFKTEPGDVLLFSAGAMWTGTILAVSRSAFSSPLPAGCPWWCRPVVWFFHAAQPIVRAWHRHIHRMRYKQPPRVSQPSIDRSGGAFQSNTVDLYWESTSGVGREKLLDELVLAACGERWGGRWELEWSRHDIELLGTLWHDIHVSTATEDLGGSKRFTRSRITLRPTTLATTATVILAASGLAVLLAHTWIGAASVVCGVLGVVAARWFSRRRCIRSTSSLLATAGHAAGLTSVRASSARSHQSRMPQISSEK